jgi:energy-coupling factor transporter transmembrane protein EcfT
MFFALAFVLSTSVQAMLFAFTRLLAPLERAGLRPRVIAGTCALCMKLVGFVFAQWRLTSEAFVSRGVRPRVSRVVPHVVVATLHHADAVAEALIARGLNVGELHHGKRPDA